MKSVYTQFAKAHSADFEESTWTFLMPDGYEVWAGEFAIVDKQLYDKMLAVFENLHDWLSIENARRNGTHIRLIEGLVSELNKSETNKTVE